MRPEQVTKWISDARFHAFLEASGHDHDRAVALYNWNAEVSAAFLEVLYHLEILLRNAIDHQFPSTESDASLSICVTDVWLCDPELLTDESRERVNEAIQRLTIERRATARSRVIASLSFGFWRALFGGRYEDLWRSDLRRAFPNGNGRRSQVNGLVSSIGRFRNRVAHHEAIFSLDLKKRHHEQLRLVELIDGEARLYIAALSRVEKLLLERP
ncbi:MAG: hypothetical protein WBL45_08555 [Solirubrobacterales bacterium]